ncbi:MAG: class I SAM-dependent methyltransferase [Bryobacterales bacterium]|nr:class I SAM-dependent methyltransferase [Bryobacterales bacterium]
MKLPTFTFAIALLALLVGAPAQAQQSQEMKKSLAPYVTSPHNVVERMLELCGVDDGKVVYDLGCGDGRILIAAAKKHGAHAVGVELSPKWAQVATDSAVAAGVQDKVRVLQQDMMDADLSGADVVTLYLISDANSRLRPKLEKELRPGACVVSHDFEIEGWKPRKVEKIMVYQRPHSIYVYRISAKK